MVLPNCLRVANAVGNFSSLLKTFETIKNARAKVPKDPHDISARWDYPQARNGAR